MKPTQAYRSMWSKIIVLIVFAVVVYGCMYFNSNFLQWNLEYVVVLFIFSLLFASPWQPVVGFVVVVAAVIPLFEHNVMTLPNHIMDQPLLDVFPPYELLFLSAILSIAIVAIKNIMVRWLMDAREPQ